MTRFVKRGAVFFTVLLALSFAPATAAFHQGENIEIRGVSAISTLNGVLSDPTDPASESTRLVVDLFQESLIDWRLDEREGSPELIGELADSFGPLDDDATKHAYVFHLKPDVTWHDGAPFTASDVEFTFDAVLSQGLGSPYRNQLDNALVPGDAAASACAGAAGGGPCRYYAFDAETFVVYSNELSEQDFYKAMIIPIIPKHVWEDVTLDKDVWLQDPGSTGEAAGRVIGTGQFQFVSRQRYFDCATGEDPNRRLSTPDEDIRLQKNPGYSSRIPAWPDFDEFILKIYTCPQGGFSPVERLDAAVVDGTVDPGSITALRLPGPFETETFLQAGVPIVIEESPLDFTTIDPEVIKQIQFDLEVLGP